MLKDVELKILASFFPRAHRAYVAKEIEQRSGYSHERVFNTLRNLEKKKCLVIEKIKKTNLYGLRLERPEIFFSFVYFVENRKKKFFDKWPIIRRFSEELVRRVGKNCDCMVLSFSEEEKNVVEGPIKAVLVAKVIDSELEKFCLALAKKYDLNITPILLEIGEFEKLRRNDLPLYRELMESSILLRGLEIFYDSMYGVII
jgi:hypothetical protein